MSKVLDGKIQYSRDSKRKGGKEESLNDYQRSIGNTRNQNGIKFNEHVTLSNLNDRSVSRQDMINESSIASHTLKLDNIDNWLSRAIVYSNNGEVKRLSEKESDIMKT